MDKKLKYEFIYPGISKFKPGKCIILMEVSKLKISFALIEKDSSSLLMLKSEFYQDDNDIAAIIDNLLKSMPFGISEIAEFKIAYYTRIFDLVPDEWFIPEEKHNYLILHNQEATFGNTLANHISSMSLNFVSSLPIWIDELYKTVSFPFNVYNGGLLFFQDRLGEKAKLKTEPSVHLHFLPDGLELLILSQKEPAYFNYYEGHNTEELLYQVLNVLNSFELMDSRKIFTSGDPEFENLFNSLLTDYAHKLRTERINIGYSRKFLKQAKQPPPNEFDFLFYLLKCE